MSTIPSEVLSFGGDFFDYMKCYAISFVFSGLLYVGYQKSGGLVL